MNMHVSVEGLAGDQLEIVTNADRLSAIGPAWDVLWRETGSLIFQSHEWISAWWSTVPRRDQRQLKIGLIWRDGRLLAVLPLAIQKRKGLRFLEWAANDCSDYADVLLDPDCPIALFKRLWDTVVSAGGFDLYSINRLSSYAAMTAALEHPDGPRLNANRRQEVSYRVSGEWSSGAEWLQSLSKKTRKNYRHGRNVLEETGAVNFRLLPPDTPLAPVLARLGELKRKWLLRQELQSSLFDEGASALPALVDVLARAGVLRIFVLECDGVTIAISVNFIQRGTLMAFLTSYDPDFERGSPGTLLIMDYIQWSIDQGLILVDFLCGAEAFKQKFATASEVLTSRMGARTPLGQLAMLSDNVRQALMRPDVK